MTSGISQEQTASPTVSCLCGLDGTAKAPERLFIAPPITERPACAGTVVLGPGESTPMADGCLENLKERKGVLSPALVCDKAIYPVLTA